MRKHIERRRSGFTLLEMMVVMAMAATLATVAVRLLDAVLRVQHIAHSRAQAVSDLTRLADSLRRDVRQARQVQVGKEQQLEIHFGGDRAHDRSGEQVQYEIIGSEVRRQIVRGDVTVARDSFSLFSSAEADGRGTRPLSRQRTAAWQWDAGHGVVTLQLLPSPGRLAERLPIRIEAVVAGALPADTTEEETP